MKAFVVDFAISNKIVKVLENINNIQTYSRL
jgi:hypothetical protein